MLNELLKSKRSSVIKNWTNQILDSYASETSAFLLKDKNRFSNPVGFTISENAEKIIDEIIAGRDLASIKILLIDILRIRAVQDFTPSEAVKFILLLKDVLRKEFADELYDRKMTDELMDLFEFIDLVALTGFDIYVNLKDQIHNIRINELRNRTAGIVQ